MSTDDKKPTVWTAEACFDGPWDIQGEEGQVPDDKSEFVLKIAYEALKAERDALNVQIEKCETALRFYYNDDIYVGGPNLEDSARDYFKDKAGVK